MRKLYISLLILVSMCSANACVGYIGRGGGGVGFYHHHDWR